MTRRCLRAQFRQPAVVRPRAGPLQFRHDILGGQAEPGTEGRRIHLGNAVAENHLSRDAVTIEHADTLGMIPGAGELLFDAAAPLIIDFLDQETLFRGLDLGNLHRQCLIEDLAILRIEITAVPVAGQSGMAIGRNNDVTIHDDVLLPASADARRHGVGICSYRFDACEVP